MLRRLVVPLLVALLVSGAIPTYAQSDQRCFPETGQCVSGRIREFWEQNGGLPVFGFPIGPQQEMMIEGKPIQAQNFERNRLELHPENGRPNDVLLGRLGADRLVQQGRDWFTFPKGPAQTSCRTFPETGHTICGDILNAWRASGLELDGRTGKTEAESLALFGMPLSSVMTEKLGDGKEYQVQWFERARFELHPENQPPYNVLLGLLGNELRDNAAPPVPKRTPPAVVAAFKAANLEAESRPLTREDYGLAPYVCHESAQRLLIKSLGDDAGGRVFQCSKKEELAALKAYYDELGKASAWFFSYTFVRDDILIQLNGDLPEPTARAYEAVLMHLP
jgi:hypothetical protein